MIAAAMITKREGSKSKASNDGNAKSISPKRDKSLEKVKGDPK